MSPYSRETTKSIAAENTFSDKMKLHGKFVFRLRGTWSATVVLQRSEDEGTTWDDVDSYAANTVLVGEEIERGIYYRFGVKTGGYTSGTVAGRLSQ
uniref:Uncharacterized protein n=1 Tax=viral metagenome TaxID=1070528 RepID=A0A6M3J228_9ZZZZ